MVVIVMTLLSPISTEFVSLTKEASEDNSVGHEWQITCHIIVWDLISYPCAIWSYFDTHVIMVRISFVSILNLDQGMLGYDMNAPWHPYHNVIDLITVVSSYVVCCGWHTQPAGVSTSWCIPALGGVNGCTVGKWHMRSLGWTMEKSRSAECWRKHDDIMTWKCFHFTGLLWQACTGDQWILLTKSQQYEALVISLLWENIAYVIYSLIGSVRCGPHWAHAR